MATAFAEQPAANAVRLSKYILTVSDLDKTYAFYHDALGIQLDGNVTELRKPHAGIAGQSDNWFARRFVLPQREYPHPRGGFHFRIY